MGAFDSLRKSLEAEDSPNPKPVSTRARLGVNAPKYVKRFQSYSEYLDFVKLHESSAECSSRGSGSYKTKWSGGTWEKAVEVSEGGWTEWKSRLRDLGISTDPTGYSYRRTYKMDTGGSGIVDPILYALGVPECVKITKVKRTTGIRFLKLMVNLSASSKITADELLRKGSAVVSLVNALQMSGIEAEIWACLAVRSPNTSQVSFIEFPLRKVGQVFDEDTVYFQVACPMALRRLGLSAFENMERVFPGYRGEFDIYAGGSYGYPVSIDERFTDADIIINGNIGFESDKEATDWVKGVYESYTEGTEVTEYEYA